MDRLEEIRKKWQMRADAKFEENKHPRDKGGRFTSKGNEGSGGGEKVNKSASFPKLKNGASYTDSLEIAKHNAMVDEKAGNIPKGSWDKVVSGLTEKDVVYQKTPEGKKVASIPGLAAKIDGTIKGDDGVRKIYESAVTDEKKITKDFLGLAKASGMYLDNLENSVKMASHFEDKLERSIVAYRESFGSDATMEELAKRNSYDLVRYTAITDNDNIAKGAIKLQKGLKSMGYKVVGIKNKFVDNEGRENKNSTYRGLHIIAESENGRKIELQIHSRETIDIKNQNHKEYEEQRAFEKLTPDEWTEEIRNRDAELTRIQVERWKNYKNPPGIEKIKSF